MGRVAASPMDRALWTVPALWTGLAVCVRRSWQHQGIVPVTTACRSGYGELHTTVRLLRLSSTGVLPQSRVPGIILSSYTVLLKGCSPPHPGWQRGCIPALCWAAAAEHGRGPGSYVARPRHCPPQGTSGWEGAGTQVPAPAKDRLRRRQRSFASKSRRGSQ